MTKEVDELDELRAETLFSLRNYGKLADYAPAVREEFFRQARAIREAETAAGFITAKLETLESVKARRG